MPNASSTVAAYANVAPQPYVDTSIGVTEGLFQGASQILDAERKRKEKLKEEERQKLRDKALMLNIEASEFDLENKRKAAEQLELKYDGAKQYLLENSDINIQKINGDAAVSDISAAGEAIKGVPPKGTVQYAGVTIARNGKWTIDDESLFSIYQNAMNESSLLEGNINKSSEYLEQIELKGLGTDNNLEKYLVAASIEENGYKLGNYNLKTGKSDYLVTIVNPEVVKKFDTDGDKRLSAAERELIPEGTQLTKEVSIAGGDMESFFTVNVDDDNSYSAIEGNVIKEIADGDLSSIQIKTAQRFKTAANRAQFLNSLGADEELRAKYDTDGIPGISEEEAARASEAELTQLAVDMITERHPSILQPSLDDLRVQKERLQIQKLQRELNPGEVPTITLGGRTLTGSQDTLLEYQRYNNREISLQALLTNEKVKYSQVTDNQGNIVIVPDGVDLKKEPHRAIKLNANGEVQDVNSQQIIENLIGIKTQNVDFETTSLIRNGILTPQGAVDAVKLNQLPTKEKLSTLGTLRGKKLITEEQFKELSKKPKTTTVDGNEAEISTTQKSAVSETEVSDKQQFENQGAVIENGVLVNKGTLSGTQVSKITNALGLTSDEISEIQQIVRDRNVAVDPDTGEIVDTGSASSREVRRIESLMLRTELYPEEGITIFPKGYSKTKKKS